MNNKCLLLVFLLSALCINANSQNNENDSIPNSANFRLFPTKNMWTFIKLDTRNGRMWQVQYSMKSDERFETRLNGYSLVLDGTESINRFILHPTTNIYTFMLLDQIDGRVWQVQWGMEFKDRLVLPIE